ncbi:hypothetical protein K470DRAFT_277723 [Piedraia hortae CBS 480.64]|uniref:Uncharacterized protein n=1 Tax=Piedraia hortae CBS 480.64 TaxID=1314780 RepID=A0A6A7BW64_9PEZI|nr:hypothetical protein K470DRAFT_277723 [Piedraia hortae CBS 480.64]
MAKRRTRLSGLYGTPSILSMGFGALQLEALTNRPLSISRRHLAASQLRMAEIEPHELSSGEWVRFLAMTEAERDRWINEFRRRRRESTSSSGSNNSSGSGDSGGSAEGDGSGSRSGNGNGNGSGNWGGNERLHDQQRTPAVSLWARQYEDAPPSYEMATRRKTPPPAYDE